MIISILMYLQQLTNSLNVIIIVSCSVQLSFTAIIKNTIFYKLWTAVENSEISHFS